MTPNNQWVKGQSREDILNFIQMGRGVTGATMKDTWTKSRGRVEAGEGGGFGVGWRDGEKMQTTVIE